VEAREPRTAGATLSDHCRKLALFAKRPLLAPVTQGIKPDRFLGEIGGRIFVKQNFIIFQVHTVARWVGHWLSHHIFLDPSGGIGTEGRAANGNRLIVALEFPRDWQNVKSTLRSG
jgi:hypothetical protein